MTVRLAARHPYGPRVDLRRKSGSKKFKSGKNRQKRIFPKIARFTGVHRKLQIKIPSTILNYLSWETFCTSQNISVIIWNFPKNYTILKKWTFFHVFSTFIMFYVSTNFVVKWKVVPREKWDINDTSMGRFANIYEKFTFLTTSKGRQIRIFMWLSVGRGSPK